MNILKITDCNRQIHKSGCVQILILKIEKVYELLFPEKKKGLAVIWLYERIKNGEFKHGIFKEKDIHHAFEAVSLIKGEPVRLQWVTYTAYILEL